MNEIANIQGKALQRNLPISKSYIGLKIEAGKKPANQGIQNSTKMFYPKFMNRVYE